MRYVVTFWDKTSRRCDQHAAVAFMLAMKTGNPVMHRGQMYSGKNISGVRTVFGYYQDKLEEARGQSKYFCKFGNVHDGPRDCGCSDARIERLITPQEALLLPAWNEQKEIEAMKALPMPK